MAICERASSFMILASTFIVFTWWCVPAVNARVERLHDAHQTIPQLFTMYGTPYMPSCTWCSTCCTTAETCRSYRPRSRRQDEVRRGTLARTSNLIHISLAFMLYIFVYFIAAHESCPDSAAKAAKQAAAPSTAQRSKKLPEQRVFEWMYIHHITYSRIPHDSSWLARASIKCKKIAASIFRHAYRARERTSYARCAHAPSAGHTTAENTHTHSHAHKRRPMRNTHLLESELSGAAASASCAQSRVFRCAFQVPRRCGAIRGDPGQYTKPVCRVDDGAYTTRNNIEDYIRVGLGSLLQHLLLKLKT